MTGVRQPEVEEATTDTERPARQLLPVFPNATQLPRRVPLRAWDVVRAVMVLGVLGIVALLFIDGPMALDLLWGVAIPLLPAVWFLAPGFWRNACPLAAMNQTPRRGGFTRARTQPAWLRRYAYMIGFLSFFALVTGRKLLFDTSATATAVLLLSALTLAFVGGWLFAGKSGWCSSVCPLLPVQRLYGQAPLAVEPNAHCQPCVGCTKNCFDFNPGVAQLADLHDADQEYAGFRRAFAGMFPGLVFGYFTVPAAAEIGAAAVVGRMALLIVLSLGVYQTVLALLPLSRPTVTALAGAVAFNAFYAFALPRVGAALERLVGVGLPTAVIATLQAALAVVTVRWLWRIRRAERDYAEQTSSGSRARVAASSALARRVASAGATVTVDENDYVAKDGQTLLEVVEEAGLIIESGCRMGVCGADPVAVHGGADCLSEVDDDERSTLERLGHAENTRMACKAVVTGPVRIALVPDVGHAPSSDGTNADPGVQRVVVIGNGIAGVTAADYARRNHPDCSIDLIGREMHPLYNRMGISRVVYGRSAAQGLHLQPDSWYDDHAITQWLNTRATAIDRDAKVVRLATGDELPYDRLVLATGGHSFVPPMDGWGATGTFVLREIDDAVGLRAHIQEHRAATAVVAGGGLLGLEAAYALLQLGQQVSVLEYGPSLLGRQLDAAASALLQAYLERLGLKIRCNTSVVGCTADDDGRLRAVRLADGGAMDADSLVVAAGVRPNLDLATEAGLEIDRGVVVDDALRTSDPNIFAVGDVAAHAGRVYGLWPAAVDQGRIAGLNAVSTQPEDYSGTTPVTMLKVVGVDMLSLGRIQAEEGDTEIVRPSADDEDRYAKLIVGPDGHLAGAILLWEPDLARAVTAAVKAGMDVSDRLDRLREGDWSVLESQTVGVG